MPFESKAQRRLFQGIARGWRPSNGEGPSPAVAKKFIADSAGEAPADLPDHASGQRQAFRRIGRGRKK